VIGGRRAGVRWVVVALREDATSDPLGLWEGGNAVDDQGNRADWMSTEPAFEADTVRIFEVLPAPD
jgi:hypothetical protein